MLMKTYKVIIVDDSALFRSLLSEIIDSNKRLDVVACAEDPYEARDLIKKHKPDVITLDIEMPKMNGLQFLKNLMRLHPLPVVMISSLTQHGQQVTLQALEMGAVDYFPKPTNELLSELMTYRQLVIEKVLSAAQANFEANIHDSPTSQLEKRTENSNYKLIAIGASTGGTEAIRHVLSQLPNNLPPIIITQHINAAFSKAFADRLSTVTSFNSMEITESGIQLKPGHIYVAPGTQHLEIEYKAGRLYSKLNDGDKVNRHKPSVDVMFNSIAQYRHLPVLAMLLTGMGADGAQGLLNLKNSNGFTLVQDQASSTVWGMPKVAFELNAHNEILPLNRFPKFIMEKCYG
ncbi:chemotaxis response regulator protein-glutamate methylesterase [Vibrio sp.]|nr:chemotaxis response regulator protein-glutamate methylesterase [Vibrio sp.]